MAAISVEGIVIRRADYRENDRMLTLLTPGGRMDVLARGCKRPKSPLLPCSELFAMGNYELAGAHGHAVVASCLLQESFSADRDPVRYPELSDLGIGNTISRPQTHVWHPTLV